MKRLIYTSLIAATAFAASAREDVVMTVNTADTLLEYVVPTVNSVEVKFLDEGNTLNIFQDGSLSHKIATDDISAINFGIETTTLRITEADGTVAKFASIPTILRRVAESIGSPTVLAFGTVEAATPGDFVSGDYGVYLSLSPSVLYQGTFRLEDLSSSVSVQLIKYGEGGGREWLLDEVESGTVTTSLDRKSQAVTIELEANFTDGTTISVDYQGKPTDLDTSASFDDMFPDQIYGNEMYYYNADGVLTFYGEVTAVKMASRTNNQKRFTFTTNPDSGYGTSQFYLQVSADLFNQGKIYMPEAPDKSWSLVYGEFQVCANEPHESSMDSGYYKNIADNGNMRISVNDDGTYSIFIDIQMFYDNAANGLTHSGRPDQLILNYTGPVTE